VKVLLVHPCKGFYGGAEEVIVQLIKYLDRNNHYSELLTTFLPDGMRDAIVSNLGLQYLDYPVMERSWWGMWKEVQNQARWADIICCFNFPATLATFPIRRPIVWYCNEPPELFSNWRRKPIEAFNRWWVRKGHIKVVVATPLDAERFENLYGVKPSRVPYGIDYEFWSQGSRKKGRGLKLLQVGTITPYKNQEWSTQVLEVLLDRGRDATLTLAGKIEDEDYIEYLKFRGLEDKVFLLGQVSREKVRELYYNHDILLHPVQGQGGWLTPYEAWCTDIPVITVPEFQESFMFDYVATSVAEAADMIEEIIREGSQQARGSWIKDELTWGKFGEGMIKIFKEV